MLNKYLSTESAAKEGSQDVRRHLDLNLLAPGLQRQREHRGFTPMGVGNGKIKMARVSQSFVRHLSKVQLLVISRGSSLACKSSTLNLN